MKLEATAIFGQTGISAANEIAKTANDTSDAIWNSFQHMTSQLISLAPKAVGSILTLVVGYLISRLVARAVTAVTEKLGLQRAAETGGFVQSMTHVGIKQSVPQIIGTMVFWLLMCTFLVASFDILDLPVVTKALDDVLKYIPKLLVATIVVVLGLLLAALLKGVIATSADRIGVSYANQLGTAGYWVLAIMTFIAAFDQLDIQFRLLYDMILLTTAGLALAFGLSFGLGGREVMSGILAGYYVRQRLQAGDQVSVCGYAGTVREVGPVATIIETEEDGLVSRHSIPNSKMLNEAVR